MDWVSSLLLATVRLAIPVLLISLAELYGQRAGMVNIGLEGLAAIGALVGFLVCYITGSNWLGLLCGALAGIAVNMIYAFSTITLCANHTVYGMAINIFAPALASFIYRVYFGTGSDLKQIVTMSSVAIPGLKDIPIIGGLLFDQSPMVYLTLLFVVFTAVFFGRTRAGLSYKSVGEHPQAAATLGINVIGVKYLACVICGALSGIGGAYLTTCYSSTSPTALSRAAASSRWRLSSSAGGARVGFCLPACSSASATRCKSSCKSPASPFRISSSR
ncbi:MAG: ABC transporter permease [Oscillospiraceae bacterium]